MSNKLKRKLKRKIWEEYGVIHSLDKDGYNIVFNEECNKWVRVDYLIWNMFGNEEINGRNIIHIDGNIRNDAIDNLRLE